MKGKKQRVKMVVEKGSKSGNKGKKWKKGKKVQKKAKNLRRFEKVGSEKKKMQKNYAQKKLWGFSYSYGLATKKTLNKEFSDFFLIFSMKKSEKKHKVQGMKKKKSRRKMIRLIFNIFFCLDKLLTKFSK